MIALARHAPITSARPARPAQGPLATLDLWLERRRQRRSYPLTRPRSTQRNPRA